MKFMALILLFVSQTVFAADPITVCQDLQLIQRNESTGQIELTPTGASYQIFKNRKGKYGYLAEVKNSAGQFTEEDVSVSLEEIGSTDNSFEFFSLLNEFEAQKVEQNQIHKMRLTIIGVEGQEQEGEGTTLVEFLARNGQPLLKGAIVSMSYAVCR